MANLKEIRVRIASVISTRQITSAMKMVAAARLRKAQDNIIQLRPYAEKLHEILSNLSSTLDTSEENIYAQQRTVNKALLIVISSNRGLCGGFNSNIVRKTLQHIENNYSTLNENGNLDIICIGKKAQDLLRQKKVKVITSYNELFENLSFDNISKMAQMFMQYFSEKKYDRIDIMYNRFKNAATQIPTEEQFLPIKISETSKQSTFVSDYIFEPNKEYIVNVLIPRSLKIQFYKALLDSNAAEQGARMTAMHIATDNASNLLRDLRLFYNKERQAAITKELLEVVSGANALKG